MSYLSSGGKSSQHSNDREDNEIVSLEKPSLFDVSNHKAREGKQVSISRDLLWGFSIDSHVE